MDPHGPARQRERVDLACIRDDEAVRILRPRCDANQSSRHVVHIGGDHRIPQLGHILAHLRVGLPSDLDFLIDGDELEAVGCDRYAAYRYDSNEDAGSDGDAGSKDTAYTARLHTRGDWAAGTSSGRRRRMRA